MKRADKASRDGVIAALLTFAVCCGTATPCITHMVTCSDANQLFHRFTVVPGLRSGGPAVRLHGNYGYSPGFFTKHLFMGKTGNVPVLPV